MKPAIVPPAPGMIPTMVPMIVPSVVARSVDFNSAQEGSLEAKASSTFAQEPFSEAWIKTSETANSPIIAAIRSMPPNSSSDP